MFVFEKKNTCAGRGGVPRKPICILMVVAPSKDNEKIVKLELPFFSVELSKKQS